jgi:hypothetical protein
MCLGLFSARLSREFWINYSVVSLAVGKQPQASLNGKIRGNHCFTCLKNMALGQTSDVV